MRIVTTCAWNFKHFIFLEMQYLSSLLPPVKQASNYDMDCTPVHWAGEAAPLAAHTSTCRPGRRLHDIAAPQFCHSMMLS